MKFYAGIGSRLVSEEDGKKMRELATILNEMGYTLRSGNAVGSDQWFAMGVENAYAQIWLPSKHFNMSFQIEYFYHDYRVIKSDDKEAFDSIDKFHPAPDMLTPDGIKYMARNYRQVIGLNEPDSEFVICWTPNGEMIGGTAQAWRIALHFGIPVYNLHNMTKEEILKEIKKLNLLQ